MKQRIAIVALLLTVIGGYLWWQGARPTAPSSTATSTFATSIWPFGSADASIRCWSMRG